MWVALEHLTRIREMSAYLKSRQDFLNTIFIKDIYNTILLSLWQKLYKTFEKCIYPYHILTSPQKVFSCSLIVFNFLAYLFSISHTHPHPAQIMKNIPHDIDTEILKKY